MRPAGCALAAAMTAPLGGRAKSVAWYDNVSDPFGRGNSVLPWNRELKLHIGVPPEQGGYEDNRIFNNGLSDEAGAGANVGFAAKVSGAPLQDEVGYNPRANSRSYTQATRYQLPAPAPVSYTHLTLPTILLV